MAAAQDEDTEETVTKFCAEMQQGVATATAPDGPYPLVEEDVHHFGTVQRYRCWQRGPNSLVHHTLPQFLADCFTRFADQEFLVYESEHLTYSEVLQAAIVLARSIQKQFALWRGACVAIAGRNYPEWVISFLAAAGFLSAVTLPVNSWWMDEELRYGLEDSSTALLIADFERLQRAPFLQELNVPAICMRSDGRSLPLGVRRFEDLVEAGKLLPPLPLQPVEQDDNAMLMYTSGTTSKPKGVVLTQRSIMSAINCYRLFTHSAIPAPQQTTLLASPLFHINGTHVGLLAPMSKGTKLVLMYKWDARRALELIQTEKVTALVGVPTNTYDLVNHPDIDKYDTSSLMGVGGGGAAFAAPMIKKVAQRFKKAAAGTGYGLTETNAFSVIMPAAIFPARPTSCGLPFCNVDVCILGDNDEKLPPGEMGEICLRGATMMKEYLGKPDKTAEVFHIDKAGQMWFRTGDLGRLDEKQFVYIMDRSKDIIIRGGENISCAEVEAAFFEHPAIAEVAAIGVPHDTLGEAVAVAVVFSVSVTPPQLKELQKFAAGQLAAFKVPSEIYIWKEGSLPRGATGKMQKREIRERLADFRKGLQGGAVSML